MLAVNEGLDFAGEEVAVFGVDLAGHHEPAAGPARNLDCERRPLLRRHAR